MIVNWRIARRDLAKRPSIWDWASKALSKSAAGTSKTGQTQGVPVDETDCKEYIRGQIHASLQHDGLLPISEVTVTGWNGSFTCKGWVVPFFGHVIESKAVCGKKSLQRCYGSGESTYFYQLDRFISDLRDSLPATNSDSVATQRK